jgi:hypothetical protein
VVSLYPHPFLFLLIKLSLKQSDYDVIEILEGIYVSANRRLASVVCIHNKQYCQQGLIHGKEP